MPEDASRDFGAFLREARERANIPLRTIATTTKISMPLLEALERNDVARLPGGIFLRAFVRAYAKEVGLDPDDTVRRFIARFPDAAATEERTEHEPARPQPVLGDEPATSRAWRVIVWSLPLVLLIVYFGFGGRFSWLRQLKLSAPKAEQQAEQAPPAPDTPVLTTPALVPPADPNASTPAGTSMPPARPEAEAAAASHATLPPNGGAIPADAVQANTVPAQPAARPSETITATATEGRFSVTLVPRGRCWVNVRSNGKIVFSSTMNPGDRQTLVLGGNVSLTVGDAGALSMEIDGKPAKPIGSPGQVKTLLMNAQNIKDFIEAR